MAKGTHVAPAKPEALFNLHRAPLGQVLQNLKTQTPAGVDPRVQALADLTFATSAKAMIPSNK